MFEAAFRNLDDTLRKDAGCSSELDYIEQTSWVLFLKYLDDYEADKEASAKLNGEKYSRLISDEFRWTTWAAPKTADGKIDYTVALTGDDLKEFVDHKLFPYLKKFRSDADHADTLEYKIGEIFHELKNKLQSGYSLREVINKVDELRFRSNEEKHEMSSLYEDKIKNMGNAGRNGGEYYTPRPLIKTIVKVVNPKIGDKVYDGAVGSAGFLCEAYEYMRNLKELTAKEYEQLQKHTFYGKEKKSLAYIIGVMNMVLHGIEAPNIIHTNTLGENIADIQEKDKVDIVLANPPFGSKERIEIQENFPIRTGETANLFLQHFIKKLKAGGKCGVVIKNTFLSNSDNASVAIRKQLLEECNLYAILELPTGAFTGATVRTVVLFFEKGNPTKNIWYYQLNLQRNLGKTNSLTEADLGDFIELEKNKAVSENSWLINVETIDKNTWDLTPRNPNKDTTESSLQSKDVLESIEIFGAEEESVLSEIRKFSEEPIAIDKAEWVKVKISDIATVQSGSGFPIDKQGRVIGEIPFYKVSDMNLEGNEVAMYNQNNLITEEVRRQLGAYLFPTGSVIFPKIGGAIATNKKRLVVKPCCVDNNVMGIIPNLEKVSSEYLYSFLTSIHLSSFANEAALPSIKKSTVENFEFYMPRDLKKQKEIAESLRIISENITMLKEISSKKIHSFDNLHKALQQQFFKNF